MLDTLQWLPSDHPARGQLETALADALIEIRPLQDVSGFWHQILDDTTAPLECSGTLTFA